MSTERHPPAAAVILAEDEALVRLTAADELREEGGFKVIETSNADEALTVLEANPGVRAVVTDVEMPGSMDGYTLARIVRRGWPQVGVVITSGRAMPEDGMLPFGALFIAKPYRPAALIEAVNAVLQEIAPEAPSAPVMPAMTVNGSRMGNGLEGGLAQPLAGPEE
jgi:CheY-like chemotaxis protein